MADQPGGAEAPAEYTGNSDRNPERRRIVLVARDSRDTSAKSPALELPLDPESHGNLSAFTKWAFTFIEAGDDWAESILVFVNLNNRFGNSNKINDHVMKKNQKHPDATAHKIAVSKELLLESEWAKVDPDGTKGNSSKVMVSLPYAVSRIGQRSNQSAPETIHDVKRLAEFLEEATDYAKNQVQKLQKTATDTNLYREKVEESMQLLRAAAATGLPEELLLNLVKAQFPGLTTAGTRANDSDLADLLRHVQFLDKIPAATWTKVMEDFTLIKIQDVFNRPAGQSSLFPKRPANDTTEIVIKLLSVGTGFQSWQEIVGGTRDKTLEFRNNVCDMCVQMLHACPY